MKKTIFAMLALFCLSCPASSQESISDQDVVDAYHYMLGRWLVLRQENLDFAEGMKWNEIIHREPGGVAWANPNLDVAYSEAWVYVDDKSCTLIDLPEIKDRYYTVQVMNGWGEVITNINERYFANHPSGLFALCLKGAKVVLPERTERIDLPGRKSRVLMRIELGDNPAEAIALQKKTTMKPTGAPQPEAVAAALDFPNTKLPGVEAFDQTEKILASDADINPGMEVPQQKARAVARAATDPKERTRIDDVIHKRAIPAFFAYGKKFGTIKDGWIHPRPAGNYGSDFLMRAFSNFAGIWANNSKEVVYYGGPPFDGGATFLQTYPKEALPASKVQYFWSVIAVDDEKFQVIPNPLNRYLLNKESGLKLNPDGSLTLAFGPKQPDGVPSANWLPTPAGAKYKLTYRFYGPTPELIEGAWFPPPMVKQ
jgi:hypothetical protein